MQERGRAYRRSKLATKKKKVSHYWDAQSWSPNGRVAQTDPGIVGRVAVTPCACGCWMCANPRKVFGIPFNETRRKLRFTGGEE